MSLDKLRDALAIQSRLRTRLERAGDKQGVALIDKTIRLIVDAINEREQTE